MSIKYPISQCTQWHTIATREPRRNFVFKSIPVPVARFHAPDLRHCRSRETRERARGYTGYRDYGIGPKRPTISFPREEGGDGGRRGGAGGRENDVEKYDQEIRARDTSRLAVAANEIDLRGVARKLYVKAWTTIRDLARANNPNS